FWGSSRAHTTRSNRCYYFGMHFNKARGIAWLPILVIAAMLIVGGAEYYYFYKPAPQQTQETTAGYREINRRFAVDQNHAYFLDVLGPVVIPGADVETFTSIDSFAAKD